ncbi:MAG TPA: nucleoside triphosphate pyrophosphohydrolase family protein [Nocardioides sp.]|uniref:nucleoside triphosphate pyrophosphohydrolase family protein n=1 Tax=Nocardioides sp. TaxID=35761 RepID=UPI002EDA60AC
MQFSEYQRQVRRTDQRPGKQQEDTVVHLLGLAGEAGSVVGSYKKYIRDGAADSQWKLRMREELGDVLWYVAVVTDHLGLNLDEVAAANLDKTRGRWLLGSRDAFDSEYPPAEQLPRRGTYEFVPGVNADQRPTCTVIFDGKVLGDPDLTDNALTDDGYRFHDVFHLAFATVLGWSPVTRSLMKRKRKSNIDVDESEDGGRAIVVEEGLSAFAFAYASRHDYLAGIERLDPQFLDSMMLMTNGLEVGARTQSDLELAVLQGFAVFRDLRRNDGGFVDFDADEGTLTYRSRG